MLGTVHYSAEHLDHYYTDDMISILLVLALALHSGGSPVLHGTALAHCSLQEAGVSTYAVTREHYCTTHNIVHRATKVIDHNTDSNVPPLL